MIVVEETLAKVRINWKSAKFLSSEYKEMFAFPLLSRDKIDQGSHFFLSFFEREITTALLMEDTLTSDDEDVQPLEPEQFPIVF